MAGCLVGFLDFVVVIAGKVTICDVWGWELVLLALLAVGDLPPRFP